MDNYVKGIQEKTTGFRNVISQHFLDARQVGKHRRGFVLWEHMLAFPADGELGIRYAP